MPSLQSSNQTVSVLTFCENLKNAFDVAQYGGIDKATISVSIKVNWDTTKHLRFYLMHCGDSFWENSSILKEGETIYAGQSFTDVQWIDLIESISNNSGYEHQMELLTVGR